MTKNQIRRNIKSNAKRMLKGNLGTAILILLIQALVSLGIFFLTAAVMNTLGLNVKNSDMFYNSQWNNSFSSANLSAGMDWGSYFVSLGLIIVSTLITIPLAFGMMEWYIRLSEGTKKPLSSVFDWFSSAKLYFKSIGMSLNIIVRIVLYVALPAGLLLTGVVALGVFTQFLDTVKQQNVLLLYLGGLVLYLVFFVLLSIFSCRYALAPYLCIRFPEAKMRSVIRESVGIMKGHKVELFLFGLSFLPWILLSFFSFGLLCLWLMPYMVAATVIFFNYVYDVAKAAGIGSMEFPPYSSQAPSVDTALEGENEVRFVEGEKKAEQNTWEQLIEKPDDSGENTGPQQ